MSTTLPLYYTLASPLTSERLDASVQLLSTLEQFQSQHPTSPTQDTEQDTQKLYEQLNAEDVRYAVKRLVGGLGSSREQSRMGFAVALTELLQRFPTVPCNYVINQILVTSQITSGLSGTEQRDLLFGRLFGLTAVVESGVLFRAQLPAVGSSNPNFLPTKEDFITVATELANLADQKLYLRESAWWAVLQAVEALHTSGVSWKKAAFEQLSTALFEENKEWTLEKLAVGIKIQRYEPSLPWPSLVAPTFKSPNLLAPANLPVVARLFKGDSAAEDASQTGTGGRRSQLHFAWSVVLDAYFSPSLAPQSKTGKPNPLPSSSEFQDFFRLVVDESLFHPSSSDTRKFWGFQVFSRSLPLVPSDQLPLLFTPNFMRTWMNHLSNPHRYLHKAALSLVEDIRQVAETNSEVAYTLVAQLTGKNGSQRFDYITKTKTVQGLVDRLDVEGVKRYVRFLIRVVCGDGGKDQSSGIDSKRDWILLQLQTLLRTSSIPKDEACVTEVLEFFAVHGFFLVKKASSKSAVSALHMLPEPLFSAQVQEKCREKLYASLMFLHTQQALAKAKALQNSKRRAAQVLDVDWLTNINTLLQKLAKDKKHVMPVLEADEDVVELRAAANSTLQSIAEKGSEKPEAASACALLLQYLLLQTYADDVDVSEILPDSIQAICKLLDLPTPSESTEEIDALPIDMLMDVLIALLESNTSHARELVAQVFGGLTKEVGGSTVQFIVEQLESKKAGDDDDDEEDEEEDVDMEDGVEDADDDEEEDEEDDDEDEDADEDEEENDEEEEDEEDEAQEAATAALRTRLGEVLRANGLAADSDDDEDEDEDDEESEEEYVDDETMLKLDDQLAAAIRSQVVDKKGQKNAQKDAMYFKIRVLDLVEIYMKNEPTNELLLQFIVPLLDLVLFSGPDEVQLSKRASAILSAGVAQQKALPMPSSDDDAVEVLRQLYERIHRADASQVVLQCCTYLTNVLSHKGTKASTPLTEVYAEALSEFVTRRTSSVPFAFFSNFIATASQCAWGLRETLLKLMVAQNVGSPFNQRKLVDLFGPLLNQIAKIDIQEAQLSEFFASVRETVYTAISQVLEAPSFPTHFVRDLLKCLLRAIRLSAGKIAVDQREALWEPSTFAALVARLEKEHNIASIVELARQTTKVMLATTGEKKTDVPSKKAKNAVPSKETNDIVTNVVSVAPSAPEPGTTKPKLKRTADVDGATPPKKKKKAKASS